MVMSPLLSGQSSPSSGAAFTVCLHRCAAWRSLAVVAAAAGLQLLPTHRLLDRCLQQFELLLVKACILSGCSSNSSSFCGCGCCKPGCKAQMNQYYVWTILAMAVSIVTRPTIISNFDLTNWQGSTKHPTRQSHPSTTPQLFRHHHHSSHGSHSTAVAAQQQQQQHAWAAAGHDLRALHARLCCLPSRLFRPGQPHLLLLLTLARHAKKAGPHHHGC